MKVSEMFLGKAPEEWSFTPKHKSSSYAAEGRGVSSRGDGDYVHSAIDAIDGDSECAIR